MIAIPSMKQNREREILPLTGLRAIAALGRGVPLCATRDRDAYRA
jgi:hypothetical protein